MRRIEDLGREARRTLGEPGPGAADGAFLAGLARTRGRRRRRDLAIGAGFAIALVIGAVAAWPRGSAEPVVPPEPAVRAAAPLRSDPMAALLLEAARIRLDGIGDPAIARGRLREVIEEYPDTDSAREAAKLLHGLTDNGRDG